MRCRSCWSADVPVQTGAGRKSERCPDCQMQRNPLTAPPSICGCGQDYATMPIDHKCEVTWPVEDVAVAA